MRVRVRVRVSSSDKVKVSLAEKKGDQVNSLLAGPQQFKETPLVALDSRYHAGSAAWLFL